MQKLIESLCNADAFDHPTRNIELIETHISWVILTGEFAYKIKKPVNFGFVDFSSLEKRKHYCEEEIRLNQRLAPAIYLGVVTINDDAAQPVISGAGKVIEYAVKMHQFPSGCLLSALLDNGDLRDIHMDWLARTVAEFHEKASIADMDMEFGSSQAVIQPAKDNFRQIRPLLVDEQVLLTLQMVENACDEQSADLQQLFDNRKAEGFIRECHGDLHLGNVILYKEKIIPFDCIEFNENLRWIDVLSEVAFMVMDLDDHQRPDLAGRFLNSYLEYTGDYDNLAVLSYYRLYRAMVRAKVNALRLGQKGLSDEKKNAISRDCANYINLAAQYVRKQQPVLIIMHGFSGSGKTTVSRFLVEALPVIRIRSDIERKRIHGLAADMHSHSDVGAGIYTENASEMTYARLLKTAENLLAAGFPVIVDAAFLNQGKRMLFNELASRLEIPFLIIDCHAEHSILTQRIAERMRYGDDASEASMEVLNNQKENHDPLDDDELKVTYSVDSMEASSFRTIIERIGILTKAV